MLIVAACLAVASFVLWKIIELRKPPVFHLAVASPAPADLSTTPAPKRPAATPMAPAAPVAAPQATPLTPVAAVGAPPRVAARPVVNASGDPRSPEIVAVETELRTVQLALRSYRDVLGGNPVGTNAEITRALLGDNLKQLKLGVPAGSRVNANGELCDRWGTPYFFHQVSKDRMEIRSAGPDHEMWTSDDRQL